VKTWRLVLANLGRKKIRTTLTIGSFAVAMFLFGLLAVIRLAFSGGVDLAGADRLTIINRISLIMPLPFSYGDRLRQTEGVADATFASWFGGVYVDEKNFFPQFAVPDNYARMFPEFLVPPDQLDDFLRDRQGAIAGRDTAERFGWKIGDRIPIRGTIFPGAWEFNLRGIYSGRRPGDDETQFWFRHDYLEEQRAWGKGLVGWYTVRLKSPDDAVAVAKAIDARFANSAFETRTQSEKEFAASFVKQMGNIEFLILTIGGVVLFTLLLVTGNTMAMAVRERTGELAVLKTLGYGDRTVLGLVLAESLVYAAVGGGIGLVLAKAFTLRGDPTNGMLPYFELPGATLALGFGVALSVGLLAGLVPAVAAMRLRVAEALRKV
jgi:putative ABC transport system permease protein